MQPSVETAIVTRTRNTSPVEELMLRLQNVAPLLHLADHEVAALMHETRIELVEDDGAIRFEIAGQKHEFYSADSPTCQNMRGKKVLIAYSRSFTDVIYVIQNDRKYIDTLPLRGTLKWFDYAALGKEIREQEVVLKRASKELEELHGGEIERRAYAGRGNIERVEGFRQARILNTFPAPANSEQEGAARVVDPEEDQPRDILTDESASADKPTNAVSSRMASPSPSASSRVDGSGLPLSADAPVTEADSLTHAVRQSRSDGHSRRSEFSVASKIAAETRRLRSEKQIEVDEQREFQKRERARLKLAMALEDEE